MEQGAEKILAKHGCLYMKDDYKALFEELEAYYKPTEVVKNNAVLPFVMPRFFLDKRVGCAAIRDRQHPKYNEDYQGLHNDTFDVVEYKHGFQNYEKGCWDIRLEDIEYLENYCDSLNGV